MTSRRSSYQKRTALLVSANLLFLGSVNAFAPSSRNYATHPSTQQQPQEPSFLLLPPEFARPTSTLLYARFPWRRPLSSSDDEENGQTRPETEEEMLSRRRRLRQRVNHIAKQMMKPMPKAIATLLSDATLKAVDVAVEEVLQRRHTITTTNNNNKKPLRTQLDYAKDTILSELTLDLVNDAFAPMERSLQEMETSLEHAREALTTAKAEASNAIEAIQAAAIAEALGAASVVETAEEQAERKMIETIYTSAQNDDILETLRIEDLEFCSGMAPPFLDESSCLVPGEPVVRVEKAPENSRRIFAGIDIMASVEDVWNVSILNYYFREESKINNWHGSPYG
jgi:hypothetical protein